MTEKTVLGHTEHVTEEIDVDSKVDGALNAKEPVVTRKELWSYYLYYNGNNSVGPLGYTLTLFQMLTTQAGYDPVKGLGSSCTASDASGQCVIPWGNGTKAVSSVVLIANGIGFAIMTTLFTTLGSACDYGTFGQYYLLIMTVMCWGAQFSCMALTVPSRWPVAMVLYIIGFVTFGATYICYTAAFPRLARNTAHTRELHDLYQRGEIGKEEYDMGISLEKNRISNISMLFSNMGHVIILCLNLSILLPLAKNPLVDNYTIVFAYWIAMGIWWFIFREPRPGPPLPKGTSYLTVGWKQIWLALRQYKKLPYTFIYLSGWFLLADGFTTTGTLVSICQNDKVSFSFLQNTYLGFAQALTSAATTLGFWYFQLYFKISTKKMFIITSVSIILIPLWGMIGIWTDKFGFHRIWEFWAYNVMSGMFQGSHYAFSQTMMAELTPPGFDNMFFGLFGLFGGTSSMIGPNVIQAIINRTGNNWMGFPFLFATCTAATLLIWFGTDVEKGRGDAEMWAEEMRGKVHY